MKTKDSLKFILITLVALTAVGEVASLEWIKHGENPVLRKSIDEWDNGTIHAVSVIKEGDLYRLWYSASGGLGSGIGTAISADGLYWEKSPQNPVLTPGPCPYDQSFIFAPAVLKDDTGYKMWYTAVDANYTWSIALATSTDGVIWTKYPGNPVISPGTEWYDLERVGDPHTILDDGVYKIWYTCQNRPEIVYAIAYATSADGITWDKHPDPVLIADGDGPDNGTVRSPSVLKTPGGFEMWYRGIGKSGDWTVCYATSSDGIVWTRYPNNPVLTGEPEGWDQRVWFPRVIAEEGRYSMWYASAEENEIGYAHLPIGQGCFLAAAVGVFFMMLSGNRNRWKRHRSGIKNQLLPDTYSPFCED